MASKTGFKIRQYWEFRTLLPQLLFRWTRWMLHLRFPHYLMWHTPVFLRVFVLLFNLFARCFPLIYLWELNGYLMLVLRLSCCLIFIGTPYQQYFTYKTIYFMFHVSFAYIRNSLGGNSSLGGNLANEYWFG